MDHTYIELTDRLIAACQRWRDTGDGEAIGPALAALEVTQRATHLRLLTGLMSDLSEDGYCAGWLIDNEHVLWGFVERDEPGEYGFAPITAETIALLRHYSDTLGGWVYWDHEETFIAREAWLARHEAWKVQQAERLAYWREREAREQPSR